MRSGLTRSIAVALALVVVLTAFAANAGAAKAIRCEVAPSPFFDIFVGDEAFTVQTDDTLLDCPGVGIVAVDIWEHALVDHPLADDLAFRGKVQIVIDFPGPRELALAGQIRGTSDCSGGVCDLAMEVSARSKGGAKLVLVQTGTLQVATGDFNLDIVEGFFNIEALP